MLDAVCASDVVCIIQLVPIVCVRACVCVCVCVISLK